MIADGGYLVDHVDHVGRCQKKEILPRVDGDRDVPREGQAKGVVRESVDPFIQMWAVFGSLDELAMQWVLARRKKFDLSAVAEQVAETFIRGIAADPAALEEA